MIDTCFWIGVAVIFCMLQVTNCAFVRYDETELSERGILYVLLQLLVMIASYTVYRVMLDFKSKTDVYLAVGVSAGLLWSTLMSYNFCYDLYRVNFAEKLFACMPFIFALVFTCLMCFIPVVLLLKRICE